MKNIYINGFGRIGRLIFRQIFNDPQINIIGINDLCPTENLAYLLEHDSAQGKFLPNKISFTANSLVVDGKKFPVTTIKDPALLPHKQLKTDLVVESTGLFCTKEGGSKHLEAGAKHVLISAPAKGDGIKTIVYNVNHDTLQKSDEIVSAASCTTNCLAPVVKILDDAFQMEFGLMTTIHAATNDQRVLDLPHKDFRRGRSALNNIIPTHTGAAAAVGKVLPHLNGKLNGIAMRVPVVTGSVVDLVCSFKKDVSVAKINNLMKSKRNETIDYCTKPIVSTDVIGSTYGSIFDSTQTSILDVENKKYVKVISYYDNENSYVSQYVRTLKYLISL